jgi:NAD-dependent deacetylase
MPVEEMSKAEQSSHECDFCIVVGSSLVVFPAANIPLLAKKSGAKLLIINYTPTDFDGWADIVIHQKAGPVMSKIIDNVKKLQDHQA